MNSFPDFAAHSFQVIKESGHNSEGAGLHTLLNTLRIRLRLPLNNFNFLKMRGGMGLGRLSAKSRAYKV